MTHLKEVDAFAEARKKLSGKAIVAKADREEDPIRGQPNPKSKAKAERAARAKAARLAANAVRFEEDPQEGGQTGAALACQFNPCQFKSPAPEHPQSLELRLSMPC